MQPRCQEPTDRSDALEGSKRSFDGFAHWQDRSPKRWRPKPLGRRAEASEPKVELEPEAKPGEEQDLAAMLEVEGPEATSSQFCLPFIVLCIQSFRLVFRGGSGVKTCSHPSLAMQVLTRNSSAVSSSALG